MGFLAPAFLFGAVAVAVPLYLHLLRRSASRPQPFSSLMFFELRQQQVAQRRRLRHWLLLALRLAIIALLALAFAQPYFDRAIAGMVPAKRLLVAIDDSFSMRAAGRLEAAKRGALTLLDSRRAVDRAQILSSGGQVHILTPPTRDSRALRAAVEGIAATDTRGSFATLARAVAALASGEHAPVELHFFSDMQKSAMPQVMAETALGPNVTLVLHAVGAAAPNWAVESVNVPSQVWDPRTARVQAVIAGYDTPAATRTVSFSIGGKTIATRRVEVPASGRAQVGIDSLPLPYGFSRGTVTIDGADELRADDEYRFSIERVERQRGLFVHQAADTRSGVYFSAAVNAAAGNPVALDDIATDRLANVDPGQYAFVVICDVASLPPTFVARLNAYVSRGGSVLVAVGTAAAQLRSLPFSAVSILGVHPYSREPERFASVGTADRALPVSGALEEWEGVRFYYAATLDERGAHVGLRLQDGTPLLLEKPSGEGRVMLFASGFDNLTNDLPLHPVFVAFVERLARYLSGGNPESSSRRVDDLLQLRNAQETGIGVEITDPSGRRALSLQASASDRTYPLERAGFYEVHLANGRHDLVAVNPDRRESDLTPLSAEALALWRGGSRAPVPAGAASVVAETGVMHASLWWYAMLVLLIAALAESFVGAGHLGTLRDEP